MACTPSLPNEEEFQQFLIDMEGDEIYKEIEATISTDMRWFIDRNGQQYFSGRGKWFPNKKIAIANGIEQAILNEEYFKIKYISSRWNYVYCEFVSITSLDGTKVYLDYEIGKNYLIAYFRENGVGARV